MKLLSAIICGIPIALVIHSLDPRRGLGARGFGVLYTFGISIALTMGSSIAFVIHSVDRSFDLALALSKAGRISIALIIHSLDRRGSLSQSLFIPLIAPYKLCHRPRRLETSNLYASIAIFPHIMSQNVTIF